MGNKRTFGICNATCSSSASVGENLCGVLELAKGVGTIEKLWCVCAAAEGPHHYPLYKPFLMTSWNADELKGYKEVGTCCRIFSILKDTAIKLHFQAVWFYRLLQRGDSEAMGGSFSRHFLLSLTTHWEWKAECLSQLCICNGLQWICAEQMHMIRAELVTQTWSESKIISENAQVYKKKMLFLPASYSLQTDRHLI